MVRAARHPGEGGNCDPDLQFEDLCEVITDKLVAKIPSSYAGKIMKLHYKNDEICQVGQPLLDMEVGDDVQTKEAPKKEEPHAESKPEPGRALSHIVVKAAEPEQAPKPVEAEQVLATPPVRALAQKMNINLKLVKGTGKDGRITKEDVLKFAEGSAAPAAPEQKAPKAEMPKPVPPPVSAQDKVIKLTGMRKAMTKSMTEALTIPHYNLQDEFGMDKLKKIRKVYMDANPGKKITFLPFFVKAFSLALLDFPVFNSLSNPQVDKEGYIYEYIEKADHNISIAIDTPSGLVVPNLKAVQYKSILQINEEIRELIDRTRKGTLTQADLTNGTFTLSNIGNIGGMTGSPVIFRPQVAIAAMGQMRMVPDFVKQPNGEFIIKPKEVISVSVSCDHRVVDGATGARFVARVKQYIESIDSLLLTLK